VEQLVELKVEAPSRHSTLVEVKQLESMSPRSKMVVEVKMDHMNLMAEQHRASCLKLRVEEHRAEVKLRVEERMAKHLMLLAEKSKEEHMKLMMAEEHWAESVMLMKQWAEHMKSKVDFLFLTSVLHLCFPSSLAQPYFSSQEANCA